MANKKETRKIIDFVSEQYLRSESVLHWRKRLPNFGFAIEDTDDGMMIAMLPKRTLVCAVPAGLIA